MAGGTLSATDRGHYAHAKQRGESHRRRQVYDLPSDQDWSAASS